MPPSPDTDLQARIAELEAQVRFQSGLLDAAGRAILVAGTDGRVTYLNREAERLFGWHGDEALGQDIKAITGPPAEPDLTDEILDVLRRGETWQGELTVKDQSGRVFPAHVVQTPVFDGGTLRSVIRAYADISERVRYREALRFREQFLDAIYNSSDLAVFVVNVEGPRRFRYVGINPAHERLVGVPNEKVAGKSPEEIAPYIGEHGANYVIDLYQACVDKREPIESEAEIEKDGVNDWWLTRLVPMIDDAGKVWRIVGSGLVITGRRKSEDALRASEGRYRALLEALPDLIFELTADGVHLDFHAASEEELYLKPGEFLGRRVRDVMPADAAELFENYITRTLANSEIQAFEYQLNFGGKPRFYECRTVPTEEGTVLAIVRDITVRTLAERALAESESRYRILLENAPVCIHEIDLDGRLTSMNRSGLAMLGQENEDAVRGAEYLSFVADRDRERIAAHLQEALAGRSCTFQFDADNDAGTRTFDSSFMPIADTDGRVVKLVGVTRDITERLRSQEAIRASEARFREMAELLPDAIYEADRRMNVTYANRAALDLFGMTDGDLAAGFSGFNIIAPADRDRARATAERRLRGEPIGPVEYLALRKDGTTFPVLLHTSPITKDEELVGFRGVIVDITERKRLEQELLKSQNLESLGLLAGGIAHDFNNLLTGVMGNLALLERMLEEGSQTYRIAAEAARAAERSRGLTQQLMTFARGSAPVKQVTQIESLIEETTRLSLSGANTSAEFDISDGLWAVEVEAGQISQVIQNIVLNADQAMPDGGTLEITARNVDLPPGTIPTGPGRYIRVSFKDAGIGIPEAMLGRIFDPYFSMKDGGHGLGLSISHSIIHKHGGHIAAHSVPGEGTTFEFYLPASERPAASADPSRPTEAPEGTGRVLLMDDEEVIHQTVGSMLRALGYEVEGAKDGAAAIEIYRGEADAGRPFDAVIMDLTIAGGMGGKEAIGKLLEVDPDARVIVSSGYSEDPVMSDHAEYGFVAAVAKPVNLETLAVTLKQIIEKA